MLAALHLPRSSLGAALALLSSALPTAFAGDARVDYLVRIEDPAGARVDLEARISGLPARRARVELTMIERYAFAQLPAPRLVEEPRAIGSDRTELPITRPASHAWVIEKGEREELSLAWSVRLDHRALPEVGTRDAYEFPYLDAEHGLLVTGAMLLLPSWTPAPSVTIRFELPAGWQVLAPWPRDEEGRFHPAEERELASNLVAIGRWSSTSVVERGAEVLIAFAPGQEALERAVLPLIRPVLALELELFAHRPFERYLVLFGRPDTPGLAGSPKAGAMTLSAELSGTGPRALEPLVHLIAHEFFHTWAASRFDAQEELRFVNEGFTDFYAHLVPVLTGYSTWEDLGEELGRAMTGWIHGVHAARLSLVEAGGAPFFASDDANRLVYAGGTVLAALWDAEIRRAKPGSSLIDFIRLVHNDERWRPRAPGPGLGDVERALATFVGVEKARELVGLARAPDVPDLPALFAAAGAKVEASVEPASLELRVNFDGARITAMDPVDLARRLGLREGDELLSVNGREIATTAEIREAWRAPREGRIHLRFARAGEEHEIDAEHPVEQRFRVDPVTWFPIPTTVRYGEQPLSPSRDH